MLDLHRPQIMHYGAGTWCWICADPKCCIMGPAPGADSELLAEWSCVMGLESVRKGENPKEGTCGRMGAVHSGAGLLQHRRVGQWVSCGSVYWETPLAGMGE